MRAALSEFARSGFEGASTRAIAEAAEVPHSLVLYHFGNKEELWLETVKASVQWYTRHRFGAPARPRRDDPVGQLRRHFRRYVYFSAQYPDFFRMFTNENKLESERLKWFVTHHTGPFLSRIAGLIAEAQALGAFVEGDPLTLIYLFIGAATIPYRSASEIAQITGERTDTPEAIERHLAMLDRLFFRTPPTPPSSDPSS